MNTTNLNMKTVLLVLAVFTYTLGFSQPGRKIKPEGKWSEFFGFDSVSVFKAEKGFRTYLVDPEGGFKMTDSISCNNHTMAIDGKWQLSENRLVVQHNNIECIIHWPEKKFDITWLTDDLFYSVYVSSPESTGEKQYTVFRRIR